MTDDLDWAQGDLSGLRIPAHSDALRQGGAAFLTAAFRSSGAIGADNRVTEILRCTDFDVGGTGRKARLTVAYAHDAPGLHTELFVKFSRNLNDARRDSVRHMMAPEVKFAALSREPGFPIAVPDCLFADFNDETGTGILITQTIPFGQGAVERQYEKCLDHEIPALLDHYEALICSLARLSGAHKAGRLAPAFATHFPFDAERAIAADRIRWTPEQMQTRIERIAAFAARYPHLLPDNIKDPSFLAQFAEEAPRFLEHETAIRRSLFDDPSFIALCHWNANIDNGWFWRDASSRLNSGLMDWGQVGQMNVAQAIYGGLSGAEPEFWGDYLNLLLSRFAEEFYVEGGGPLNFNKLKRNVHFVTATMGLAYILDAPARIEKSMPDLAEMKDARDPRFKTNEDARVWLHMLTMFLNQWEHHDFGDVLTEFLQESR